ncbi:hypothetical protein, partial [Aromatoleum petrolei]|uniref:hypothetical protein n=1 Tax=Aromatoleum petrolei TaxID=76116 RepID=UPI001B7CFE93
HSHLSVVQFFKEPLPKQRERDSDKLASLRQAPQQTFFQLAAAPPASLSPPAAPDNSPQR